MVLCSARLFATVTITTRLSKIADMHQICDVVRYDFIGLQGRYIQRQMGFLVQS